MLAHSPKRRRRARGVLGGIALASVVGFAAWPAHAGIFRNVLVSVGLAKPEPKPDASDTPPVFPRQGFACCNLHYDGDWVSDYNYGDLPMIPAGTPIEVLSYGRERAMVKVDGRPMRLGHDYGRNEETLNVWVNKLVVNEDPRPRIASYSPAVQAAIHASKVMVGMTREQAIVAVGYPVTSENPSLDSAMWRLFRSGRGQYQLNFGPDGRVASITGDDAITSQAIYLPGK
jgi:hypothetical protein